MPIQSNQFSMQATPGQVDLIPSGLVFAGQVSASQGTNILPGQPVAMEDSAGNPPKILSLAANTTQPCGVVAYNPKDSKYAAGDAIEIAAQNSVVYMTANAAIARYAKVECIAASGNVTTSLGTNPILGRALDKAAANGDLIRVLITLP